MKILAISDSPDRPETALLAGLAARGHAVTLMSAKVPSENLVALAHIQHRITSRISYATIRKIGELAPQFDIIHCFSARAVSNTLLALALFARAAKKPKVVAYRGTVGHLSRLDPTAWLSFLNPRIAAISCVSEAVKRYLVAQGVPAAKLFTIYKGHDPSWYERSESIDVRAEFGIKDAVAPIICFVGNMRAVKGAEILVDAFSQLNHPSAHLLLVGEVRDSAVRRAIERSARAFNIHLLGPRKDAPAIVRGCDIFVMPSRAREGLPKAVIEALLLSKPVIISDAGGMPEMITDGESGALFPAGDSAALAQRLAALIDDKELQSRLGNAGRARAVSQFDVTRMINATEALYQQVTLPIA